MNIFRYGQPSASTTHTFRTVIRTCAPIFNNFSLIVQHCAFDMDVPASPILRKVCNRT